MSAVGDQMGSPIGAKLIGDVTAHALEAMLGGKDIGGNYHIAAAGKTFWHGGLFRDCLCMTD